MKMFAVFVLIALIISPCVADVPALPHVFYGNVTAPDGTLVEGRVAGYVVTADNPVQVYNNKYGESGLNKQQLFVQGNIANGSFITFYVGGINTGLTYPYTPGEVTNLDIPVPTPNNTIITTIPTTLTTTIPTTIPTTSITTTPTTYHSGGGGGGGGGSGGYSYTTSPTTKATTVKTTVPTTVPTTSQSTTVAAVQTTSSTTIPTTTAATTTVTTIGNMTSGGITGDYTWVIAILVGLIAVVVVVAYFMNRKKEDDPIN